VPRRWCRHDRARRPHHHAERSAKSGGFTAAQLPLEAPPAPHCDHRPELCTGTGAGRRWLRPLGDKGDNPISASSRRPEYEPILDAEVTEEAVANTSPIRIQGKVTRCGCPHKRLQLPVAQALGRPRHGTRQGRPLAKAFAQMLLDIRCAAGVAGGRSSRLASFRRDEITYPEERPVGPRLEGWQNRTVPTLRDAASRPPQG